MVKRPPTGTIPELPGLVPVQGRPRPRDLRRQGVESPSAPVELLPVAAQHASAHGADGGDRGHRSSGRRCATRSKRSCSSSASSSSTTHASTCGCATTRATRSWRSPSTTSGRGRWSCAAASARAPATSGRTPHAYAIRDTLDLLLRSFPIRTCSPAKFNQHERLGRPCLLFHIEKCAGPCVGEIDQEAYRELVDELMFVPRRRHRRHRQPARARDAGLGDGTRIRASGAAA